MNTVNLRWISAFWCSTPRCSISSWARLDEEPRQEKCTCHQPEASLPQHYKLSRSTHAANTIPGERFAEYEYTSILLSHHATANLHSVVTDNDAAVMLSSKYCMSPAKVVPTSTSLFMFCHCTRALTHKKNTVCCIAVLKSFSKFYFGWSLIGRLLVLFSKLI